MTTFIDTSALLALLDRDEDRHADAVRAWGALAEAEVPLVTTNYVVVETTAVAQHRLGMDAARALTHDVLPLIEVVCIDRALHDAATASLLAANRRQLSLVDCASFEVMRTRQVTQAFAFDSHFAERGFAMPAGASGLP